MDEEGVRNVQSTPGGVDRLTSLPDSLLFQILSNLQSKDVVKTSLLSTSWRTVWRSVPNFHVNSCEFGHDYNVLVSFIDSFLHFNTDTCFQNFMLVYNRTKKNDHDHDADFERWINAAVDRRVQRLHVDTTRWVLPQVKMPSTVYTCDSLVSLMLSTVTLPDPTNDVVILPRLKVIKLSKLYFANDLVFEKLISGCPVLESLTLHNILSNYGNPKVLRVCSKSLLSFTLSGTSLYDVAFAVDAPRLECLRIRNQKAATESFIMNHLGSLVTFDVDIKFKIQNDQTKRNMIRDFLFQISTTKNMFISEKTLKTFYKYLRWQQALPVFRNLSYMYATVLEWRQLLILLATCPNLKSLVLKDQGDEGDEINDVPRPGCFLTSLEYVEVKRPTTWNERAMKRVSYFLENAPNLKKLTLCLASNYYHRERKEDSVILKELHAVPRLSTSCQIEIISKPYLAFREVGFVSLKAQPNENATFFNVSRRLL